MYFTAINCVFDMTALHVLGQCLLDRMDYTEAEKCLRRAVEIKTKRLAHKDDAAATCE